MLVFFLFFATSVCFQLLKATVVRNTKNKYVGLGVVSGGAAPLYCEDYVWLAGWSVSS